MGIGTTSPDTLLNIASASAPTLRIENTDGSLGTDQVIGAVEFYKTDTSGAGAGVAGGMQLLSTFSTGSRTALTFSTSNADANDTEGFRLDENGNLLVGTTDTDPSNNGAGGDAGHAFSSTGYISSARSGGAVALFNRMDSDGDIAAFRKDGTVVGTIGVSTGYTKITSGDGTNGSGLQFGDSKIYPVEANSVVTDNAVDFGDPNYRFKNLYLSGGVVFGATGGAVSSKTLDDYEEGTWTPSVVLGTVTAANSTYTKIGRLVHAVTRLSSFSDTSSTHIQISGLPYITASGNRNIGSGWGNFSEQNMYFYVSGSSTTMEPYYGGSNYQSATYASLGGTADVIIKLTYETT